MITQTPSWTIVYEKAIRDDGTLFFPERLSQSFLDEAKKTMGSYVFANQYLNEIIPDDQISFKRSWLRYYETLPTENTHTFAFIDPAISQEEHADYTALVVVKVDTDQNWYITNAQRFKINPSQIVNLCFKVAEQYKPQAIGIEDVAYQKALLYMLDEEMRRRNVVIPVTGVHPGTQQSKEMRIMGLVPRFEWGRIFISQGLTDLELEYSQFPRGSHDDLMDALSMIDKIAFYPTKERFNENLRPSPQDTAAYERWYRTRLVKRANGDASDSDDIGTLY